MKRYYTLAVALLLVLTTGMAHANFLVIRVNLGVPSANSDKSKNPKAVIGPDGQPIQPGTISSIPATGIGKTKGPYGPKQPNQPNPPKQPDQVAKKEVDHGPMYTIVVFVEYDAKKGFGKSRDGSRAWVRHKWTNPKGYTELAFDGRAIQLDFVRAPTLAMQLATRRDELKRNKTSTPKDSIELAGWCLTNGLHNDFRQIMDELANRDLKDDAVAPIIKRYKDVKQALDKVPSKEDAAFAWKSRLDWKYYHSRHYTLLYDAATSRSEVTRRGDRLDKNFEQFFFWFALRGTVPPMPDYYLTVAVVDSEKEFRQLHQMFDYAPLVADGFYSRRDNLAVLSVQRLDEPYDALNGTIKELAPSWDFKSMLAGARPVDKLPEEIAYAQTMALVQKCLQEEAEIAAVSHEGTRQLLTATGFLPRMVVLPEWVQFGLPSVFSTGKYDPLLHTGAFWSGFGMPSWTHRVYFELMETSKELEPAEDALKKVLTDAYFREARLTRSPEALLRARTMSWALCYYLLQRQGDALRRYGEELARLPRDLEFDDDVSMRCFGRAFGLMQADRPGEIDPAKLMTFATDWYRVIKQTSIPLREPLDEAKKALKEYRDKVAATPLPPAK